MSGELYRLYIDIKRVLGHLAFDRCDCGGKNYDDGIEVDSHREDCPYRTALGKEVK